MSEGVEDTTDADDVSMAASSSTAFHLYRHQQRRQCLEGHRFHQVSPVHYRPTNGSTLDGISDSDLAVLLECLFDADTGEDDKMMPLPGPYTPPLQQSPESGFRGRSTDHRTDRVGQLYEVPLLVSL